MIHQRQNPDDVVAAFGDEIARGEAENVPENAVPPAAMKEGSLGMGLHKRIPARCVADLHGPDGQGQVGVAAGLLQSQAEPRLHKMAYSVWFRPSVSRKSSRLPVKGESAARDEDDVRWTKSVRK